MSGLKNWFSEPHVPDMITSGFQVVCFSTLAMAWVQNAPEVSSSSTSAPDAASVVNWLSRFGAVGSCVLLLDDLMSVPLMAKAKPLGSCGRSRC